MPDITIYGADWCPLTQRARAHLDGLGVPYRYIDIEEDDDAAAWVAAQNNGKERKPTVDIDGTILIEPTDRELDEALGAGARRPHAAQ